MTVAAHVLDAAGGNVNDLAVAAATPWEVNSPYFPPYLDSEFEKVQYHGADREPDASIISGTGDVQYQIANYGGATHGDIWGSVSQTTLERIEDDGTNQYETFECQGARSGKHSNFDIYSVNNLGFIAEQFMEGGDSGGPFHIDNYSPFFKGGDNIGIDSGTNWNDIAGIVHARINRTGDTIVHSMNNIENITGLEV